MNLSLSILQSTHLVSDKPKFNKYVIFTITQVCSDYGERSSTVDYYFLKITTKATTYFSR